MKLYSQSLPIALYLLVTTKFSLVLAANPIVQFSECASSYLYKGIHYQGCTEADNQGKPWCFLRRTTVQDNWGYCQADTIPLRSGSFNGQEVPCDVTSDAGNGTVVHGCFLASAEAGKAFLCYSSKVSTFVTCTATKPDVLLWHAHLDQTLPKKPFSVNPSENSVPDGISKEQTKTGNEPNSTKDISPGMIGGIVTVVLVGIAGLAMLMYRRQQLKKKSISQLSSRYSVGFVANNFQVAKIPPSHLHKSYTVISTYTPTLGDELEIFPGDHVTVIVEYDDGWVQGINETRGHVKGVFPKHCVEEISRPSPLARTET